MRYSIRQLDASTWELRGTAQGDDESDLRAQFENGNGRSGYDLASEALGGILTETAPMQADSGVLLPEGWRSVDGIAFSRKLSGGRDFTNVEWSWRDPKMTTSPFMLMTTESHAGHLGAELAGFTQEFTLADGTVDARGRLYNNAAGTQARDLLLAAEETGVAGFGVSVGPTENCDVEVVSTCTEMDDNGFCVDGEDSWVFHKYEIGSLTMCAPAGFDTAVVALVRDPGVVVPVAPVRAALSIPTAPPLWMMRLPEPEPGTRFLDSDEPVLVEQVDARGNVVGMACPLTIRDDGLVYGHVTYWGQCHTGNPWGPGLCASAQPSETGYADFHTGEVKCADGTAVPTGRLVVGCEHSDAFDVAGVRDHMAHAGMGWASVHVVDGQFGPWLCGVLEPSLTESQVRMLRSLSLSGEWVGELGGILAVNASGLPVQRERLAASGLADMPRQGTRMPLTIPQAALRASFKGGEVTKLVGGNLVRACPECQKRARLAASANGNGQLDRIEAALTRLDLRTKHLIGAEATAVRERLAASAKN